MHLKIIIVRSFEFLDKRVFMIREENATKTKATALQQICAYQDTTSFLHTLFTDPYTNYAKMCSHISVSTTLIRTIGIDTVFNPGAELVLHVGDGFLISKFVLQR